MITIIRAKVEADQLSLVASVDPFTGGHASYQVYTIHTNNRTTLVTDNRYNTESEAAERFDREHQQKE